MKNLTRLLSMAVLVGGAATAAADSVLPVPPDLTSEPVAVHATGTWMQWTKKYGWKAPGNKCGNAVTQQPIASFEVKQADADLVVAADSSFVVMSGTKFWSACDGVMRAMQGGWQPGRYDVYALARYAKDDTQQQFTFEMYKPGVPAPWDKAQKLVISGHLDKPMFVEVTTRAGRRALREVHAGAHCNGIALPFTPDLALEIERPIPGLTIRPLATASPVVLRTERAEEHVQEITGKRSHERYCVRDLSGFTPPGPSYHAASELYLGRDEGKFGLSIGTPDATQETKVTLMIFDDATQFDELAPYAFGGDQPTLAQRWIGNYFPQLVTGELGTYKQFADVERSFRVFAAAPKQARVYAKLDLDKDIASGTTEWFPKKNEPLLVVGQRESRVIVMTSDGLRFSVQPNHLLLAPDGDVAVPAAPRPLPQLDYTDTSGLLPPSGKKLVDAFGKKFDAREKCLDKAWAPYGAQLPEITRPSDVDLVIVKSAGYKRIEEAGQRAMDRQCGTAEAFEKQREAVRQQYVEEIEKARAKLFADVAAKL